MSLSFISTEQCFNKLQNYATTEVRSWNPFKLFRKEKLKNHALARDIAIILSQTTRSDKDLLKIANAIDNFEDSKIQHALLCFLYTKINDSQDLFVTRRENINQINKSLHYLSNKKYSPWWTLFLIDVPYYSDTFRNNVTWLRTNISKVFTTRRAETKKHLINVYSKEELVKQIINEYHSSNTSKDIEQQKELGKILDLTLDQTIDRTRKELIKEIKKKLITEIPFGQVLISVGVLSSIINSYVSKNENQSKSTQEQAQEILYIIGKIFIQANAPQVVKSFIPGVGEIVEAAVSVVASQSPLNPLHTDQKIGSAVASAAGGAVGGAIGTVIPIVGTYIGAYVGAVLSKTAATRFYQVLQDWQKAPKGLESIIPGYPKSFLALIDNDAKNILDPLYKTYLATEHKSKLLGDEIAKWLCIYTLVQNSNDKATESYLEIINEEMNRLRLEFNQLKDSHSKKILSVYRKQPDNLARVYEYKSKVKECLHPLHQPIIGMLNEYFSPTVKVAPKATADSCISIARDLPSGVINNLSHRPLAFFDHKKTDGTSAISGEPEKVLSL